MNIFYAPPERHQGELIKLTGQEARHASKVLRYREGDDITVTNGKGGWYEGEVRQISSDSVLVGIRSSRSIADYDPSLVLGLGIIRKRDRLEFAIEKAVELGVSAIALFRGRHSVKENVRMDRLEATALSAMKQSLRAWLPEVKLYDNVEQVLQAYNEYRPLIAHEKADRDTSADLNIEEGKLLLMVGPEGGFSKEEISSMKLKGGETVSLGEYRLRTETAAITLINRFSIRQ